MGVARRKPRQARAQRTVDAVVDAAAQLFSELGYRETTTNDIAATAGVSIGSLYQYFADKDEVLVEIYRRHVREARAVVLEAVNAHRGAPPSTWAASLVHALVELNDTDLGRLLLEVVSPPADARREVGILVAEVAAAISVRLDEWGIGEAEERGRLLASVAISTVHEVVIQAGASRDRASSDLAALMTAFIEKERQPKR